MLLYQLTSWTMIAKPFYISSKKIISDKEHKISDYRQTKMAKIKERLQRREQKPEGYSRECKKSQEGFSIAFLQFANTLKQKLRIKKLNRKCRETNLKLQSQKANQSLLMPQTKYSNDKRFVNKSTINISGSKDIVNLQYIKLATSNIFSYVRKGRAFSTNSILKQLSNDLLQDKKKQQETNKIRFYSEKKSDEKFSPLGPVNFSPHGGSSKVELVRQLMKLAQVENYEDVSVEKGQVLSLKKQARHDGQIKTEQIRKKENIKKTKQIPDIFESRPKSLNFFHEPSLGVRQDEEHFGPWAKA